MRIYTHSECTEHLVPDGHSERPNRLTTLLAHLEKTGIASELPYFEAKPIDKEQALLVHKLRHLEELERLVPSMLGQPSQMILLTGPMRLECTIMNSLLKLEKVTRMFTLLPLLMSLGTVEDGVLVMAQNTRM